MGRCPRRFEALAKSNRQQSECFQHSHSSTKDLVDSLGSLRFLQPPQREELFDRVVFERQIFDCYSNCLPSYLALSCCCYHYQQKEQEELDQVRTFPLLFFFPFFFSFLLLLIAFLFLFSSRDLLRIVQQEAYTYSDPITEVFPPSSFLGILTFFSNFCVSVQFVDALFVQFDFESAQQKLRECEILLKNDYFLHSCHEVFLFPSSSLFLPSFLTLFPRTFWRTPGCSSLRPIAVFTNASRFL